MTNAKDSHTITQNQNSNEVPRRPSKLVFILPVVVVLTLKIGLFKWMASSRTLSTVTFLIGGVLVGLLSPWTYRYFAAYTNLTAGLTPSNTLLWESYGEEYNRSKIATTVGDNPVDNNTIYHTIAKLPPLLGLIAAIMSFMLAGFGVITVMSILTGDSIASNPVTTKQFAMVSSATLVILSIIISMMVFYGPQYNAIRSPCRIIWENPESFGFEGQKHTFEANNHCIEIKTAIRYESNKTAADNYDRYTPRQRVEPIDQFYRVVQVTIINKQSGDIELTYKTAVPIDVNKEERSTYPNPQQHVQEAIFVAVSQIGEVTVEHLVNMPLEDLITHEQQIITITDKTLQNNNGNCTFCHPCKAIVE